MLSSSICVIANGQISFFYGWIIFFCVYHIFFIRPSIDFYKNMCRHSEDLDKVVLHLLYLQGELGAAQEPVVRAVGLQCLHASRYLMLSVLGTKVRA